MDNITSDLVHVPEEICFELLQTEIRELNNISSIVGMFNQLPVYKDENTPLEEKFKMLDNLKDRFSSTRSRITSLLDQSYERIDDRLKNVIESLNNS